MKRAFTIIKLLTLTAIIVLTNLIPIASATNVAAESQISLKQHLIGTWRWEHQHSWILIFREDSTMLDGPPGFRTVYSWQIVDDRLIVDGVDWNIRLADNTITIDRYGRSTHTYVWYSDSTEGETTLWLIAFIGIIIAVGIGIFVFIFVRRSRRKKRQIPSQF